MPEKSNAYHSSFCSFYPNPISLTGTKLRTNSECQGMRMFGLRYNAREVECIPFKFRFNCLLYMLCGQVSTLLRTTNDSLSNGPHLIDVFSDEARGISYNLM